MKVSEFSLSAITKHLIAILCTVWATNALAYLKINYNSTDLSWQSEEYRFGDEDEAHSGDFFINETINFNVDLIIPDVEFPGIGFTQFTFDDAITNISTSNLFGSPLVTNSRFELIQEDPWFIYWGLTFDVIESAPLENGTARGGSFSAGGYVEWGPDGSGFGDGSSNFMYHWDNWVYQRHDMQWILNSDVQFANYYSQLTIEKVSVPEPFSLGLFLAGLGFIVFTRRKIK